MWRVQESIGGRAGGARLEKEMEGTIHGTADELSERAALDNDKEPDEHKAAEHLDQLPPTSEDGTMACGVILRDRRIPATQ